jgi:hypothetical protein
VQDALGRPDANGSAGSLQRLGELAAKTDSYDAIEADESPPVSADLNRAIYAGVWPEAARLRRTGELLQLTAHIECPVLAIHGAVVDEHSHVHPLRPEDVAVIAPHVEQASAVTARLADVRGVPIGTANQTQGLEREAVVVIHPLAGYREAPAFATDPGRLCVALSRHRTRLPVMLDEATDAVLRHA